MDGCLFEWGCTSARVEDVGKGLLEIAACIKHDHENGFETKEDCGGTKGVLESSCVYKMYSPRWGKLY